VQSILNQKKKKEEKKPLVFRKEKGQLKKYSAQTKLVLL
jgi:hypothetical protein